MAKGISSTWQQEEYGFDSFVTQFNDRAEQEVKADTRMKKKK